MRALPKVELHLHLEGAAPPDFVRRLAAEKGRDLSGLFRPDGSYAWSDFADFLARYERACSVLQTPEDYRRLTEAVLARSAADGVVYTEIFVAPDLLPDWAECLAAIREGAAAVPGIELGLIAIAIRHFGTERAEAAARLAARGGVEGFGMAGEERHGTVADYARAFAIAGDAGLGLTVHAGEMAGASSVRAALDALPVTRIGHGVRAAEDPDLVRRLAEEGVVLEVCPGSNLALGLYPSLDRHPIAALRAAGVAVTVSTDDPPWWHTDMVAEYRGLAAAFGWTPADFRAINETALAAAFCDAATRGRIRERLEAACST